MKVFFFKGRGEDFIVVLSKELEEIKVYLFCYFSFFLCKEVEKILFF